MADSANKTADTKESGKESSNTNTGQKQESLEDLLSTLSGHINSSDWLQQNTPEKFAQDNPEVAQAFQKISQQQEGKSEAEKS